MSHPTESTVDAPPSGERRRKAWAQSDLRDSVLTSPTFPIACALLIVCIVMTLLSEYFLTVDNFTNILVQASVVGIAAVGGTFVIITSGIDLSVGSVVALSGMVAGQMMSNGSGAVIGLIVTLGVAVLIGAFNGASIAGLKLAPFIVTLAVLGMGSGLTLQISQGESVYGFPSGFNWLGGSTWGSIPVSVIIMLLTFAAGHVLLTRTTFGHKVFAIGGNREAARLAGIPDRQTLFFVYVLAGLCAGIAAIVLAGRLGSATPNAGDGLELQVIAAVVIGGTSLFGGKGSMLGTLVGVLLIGVINNGLILLNVSPFLVQFVQGALILVAVLVDAFYSRVRGSGLRS